MLAWHSRGADRCRKPKSSESSYAQIGYSYSDSTSLPIPPPPPLDDGEDDGDDDGDEKGDNDSDSSHSEQVDEEELLEREGRKYGIRGFCDLRRRDEADAPTADDAPERSSRSDRRRERPRHKHQSTDESYELLTARGSESKGALPTDADCMDWTDWTAAAGAETDAPARPTKPTSPRGLDAAAPALTLRPATPTARPSRSPRW